MVKINFLCIFRQFLELPREVSLIAEELSLYFNRIKFREIKFSEPNNSRKFLDLISRVSDLKNSREFNFANEPENSRKWHKCRGSTGFSTQNAMLKISRGFYFANQQSHTFWRVLISRKWQKFAKPRDLISRKSD